MNKILASPACFWQSDLVGSADMIPIRRSPNCLMVLK
jgi:hypothetical protein